MHNLIAVLDDYALEFFLALVGIGAGAVAMAWRRRMPFEDDPPVPMLRKRTATALLALAGGVFALIAAAILREGRLVGLDVRVTAAIRATFGDSMLRVLARVTELGNVDVLIGLGIVVALALLYARRRLLAGLWIFSVVGNGLLIRLLKDVFQRTRPLHEHGFALETGFSFPSGHAAGSLVFYGMSAYLMLVLCRPYWHRSIVIAAGAVIGVIGASRVLLQVHYLSDVCAGYALGFGWLALCVGAGEWLRTARRSTAPPKSLN